MHGTTITVTVVAREAGAQKEISALLRRDPECVVVDDSNDFEHEGFPGSGLVPDLVIFDTGAASESLLSELIGELTELGCGILVVAPDGRYALEAHQLRVWGYVTRPLLPEAFFRALEGAKIQVRRKAIEEHSGSAHGALGRADQPRGIPGRLMVKSRDHIHVVKVDSIDWIEADAGYYWIHTQGKKHLLRGKMKWLEESLPDDRFVRIHRSLIVNIDRIQELQHIARGEYHAILNDGTKLSVSRNYRSKLFSAFARAT